MAETIIKYNRSKNNKNREGNFTNITSVVSNESTSSPINVEDYLLWEKSSGTNSLVPKSSFNAANGDNAIAVGTYTQTTNEGEFALGRFNKSTSGETFFTVGNGSDDAHRSNLFEVGNTNTIVNNNLSGSTATFAQSIKSPIISGTNGTFQTIVSSSITSNTINVINKLTANQLEAVSGYVQTLLSDDITVDNLTVTKAAHFFQLIIDEIKATQGQVIITAANAKLDKVTEADTKYICYWKASDDDKTIYNQFEPDDLVICQTFNLDKQSNLIQDSKFTNLVGNWNASNTWLTADYSRASASNGEVSFIPLSQRTMLAQKLTLQPSTQYTLSLEIKQDVASLSDASIAFHAPVIDTTKPMRHNADEFADLNDIQGFDLNLTNEYQTFSVTFTTKQTIPQNVNLEIYCYDRNTTGDCKTYITNPSLFEKSTSNKYYWRKVIETGTTEIDGEQYNYIELSKTDYDTISNDVPVVGDEIVQLGNKTDKTRQAAIVISAYNNQFLDPSIAAPSIVQYSGINDYELKTHRLNVISKSFNLFKGNFTSVNGDNLETQITNNATQIANNTSMIQQTNSAITTEVTNRINGDKKYFPIIKPFYDYEFKLITEYKDNPLRYYGDSDIYSTPTYVTAGTYKLRLFSTDTNLQDIIVASYGTNYPSDLGNYSGISLSLNRTYNSNIKCKDNTTLYEFTGEVTISTAGYYSLNFWEEDEYLYIPDMENEFETNYSRITQTANSITSQVQSLSGSVSTIDQKADNISLQVQNLSGEVSTIDQKADNILLQVQDCGINIDEKSITLNGDTNVNGTLTINDEDTGFLLAGNGGSTQISPKSLGTYSDFTSTTTNALRAIKSYSIYISNPNAAQTVSATWSFTQSFGNVQSGASIPLTLQNSYFRGYRQSSLITPSSTINEYKIYIDDTLVQTYTNYQRTISPIGTFTTSSSGELKIFRSTTAVFSEEQIQANPIITGELSYKIEIPNGAFTLIGYDGIASNFGTNANVYFGSSGAFMKYGQIGLGVTASGLTKWNGTSWVPLNYLNVVRTSSTNYTIPDNVDMIVTTGSADQNVIFPFPSTCVGRVIYVKRNAAGDIKIWCGSTSTTSENYFLRPGDWATYDATFWQDSPLNMYISDGQHWIRGYQG